MKDSVVVIVDPWSTGSAVAAAAKARGYEVISLWSSDATEELREPGHCAPEARDLVYYAVVQQQSTIEKTAEALKKALKGKELAGIVCGGDTGVTLSDAISEHMGLLTNGTKNLPSNRRDKAMQQEVIRAKGIRAVRQAKGTKWSEVAAFAAKEPLPLVVKPTESAGSDGVKLCDSVEEAEKHFNVLMSGQRRLGCANPAVLVQEFLKGKEYVIDHVSRDGVHKTMLAWVYDKRPCNGAAFVYYGMNVVTDEALLKTLVSYTRKVLDALNVKHGATHGEIMMTSDGPCLVEMNCRCAGIDGGLAHVQSMLTGNTQVQSALDCYLNKPAFDKLPDVPSQPYKGAGQVVFLVSMNSGVVKATPGYDKIAKMETKLRLMPVPYNVGDILHHSVDLFSCAGLAIMAHENKSKLDQDVETIRKMETDGTLFEIERDAGGIDDVQIDLVGRRRGSSDMDEMRRGSSFQRNSSRDLAKATKSGGEAGDNTAAVFVSGLLIGILVGTALSRLQK